LQISHIKLTNFKNYKSGDFDFNPRYNAIVGLNGMGKTNLLDAIYFTCMTKSYFTSQDRIIARTGEDFFRIEAKIDQTKVVCKYSKSKKKIFELNSKPYTRLADHVGKYRVVFIAPNDQSLLLEGSVERRKLIDNTISQLDKKYLMHLIKYNSLLNQRNAYLKLAAKTGQFTRDMVMTYTKQMNEPSDYIYNRRMEFAKDFESIFSKKYKVISNHQEEANSVYKSQLSEGNFFDLTAENIQKDRVLARTSIGIHKDDLVFKMNGNSVKYFASQGQTKSFILAIKLAQYEILTNATEIKPILLLDDLFDKLDHKRVQQLLELIESENVDQVFISDTDTDRVVNILEGMKVDYKKILINNRKYASEEE
jgi:DNA replication and repair protein RecF